MSYNAAVLALSPVWYQPLNGTLTGTGLTEGTNTFWDGSAGYATSSGNDNDMGVDSGGFVKFQVGTTNAISITSTTSIFNDKVYSFAFWFRSPTVATATKQIFHSQNGTSRVDISLSSAGAITAIIQTGSATRTASATGTYGQRLDDGFWHHVVYTVAASGSEAGKVYIDGTFTGYHSSNGGTLNLDASSKFWGQTSSGANRSDLWLDELSVFNTTLTQANVTSLYQPGQIQWSYSNTVRKFAPDYLYSGNSTSSSHPVLNSGNQGNGSTSGTYLSTTGSQAFTGANGFEFDRSTYTGINRATSGLGSINDRSFSMGAWIKTSGTTGFLNIIRIGTSGTNQVIWRVRGTDQTSPGQLEAYVGNVTLYTTTRVDDGNWHYVALKVELPNTNYKMWVDGVQRASASTSGMATLSLLSEPTYIGTGPTPSIEAFVGKIDELMVHPLAMSDYDLATLFYASGLYNQNPDSTSVSLTDVPMTASADLVDPTFLADMEIAIDADPLIVSNSELILPTISAETPVSVSADPMTASSDIVDPTVSAGTDVNIFSYGSTVLDKSPIIYLPFDQEPYNRNFGSATYPITLGIAPADPAPVGGGLDGTNCMLIDGDDYIEFNDSGTIDWNNFTFSGWVTTISNATGNFFISNYFDGSTTHRLEIGIRFGEPYVRIANASTTIFLTDTTNIDNGLSAPYQLSHIAVTASAGVWKLYVNGLLKDTQTLATPPSLSGDTTKRIGDAIAFVADEFAFFGSALSATDIALQGTTDRKFALVATQALFPDPTVIAELGSLPMTASATMVDSLIDTTSDVSEYWLIDAASSLLVDPTFTTDFESINSADPMLANAEVVDVNIETTSNLDYLADYFQVTNSELIDPIIYAEFNISITATVLTASVEIVEPTLNVEQGIDVTPTALNASALMRDPVITVQSVVIVLADPMEVSDSMFVDPIVTAEFNALWNALPMVASARKPILDIVQGNYGFVQDGPYFQAVKSIGAEIHVSKTIVFNNAWTDRRVADPNNVLFGYDNTNDGVGVTQQNGTVLSPANPPTVAVATCNESKWGGIFTGTEYMNFYPEYDRYTAISSSPTAAQLNGNEDWTYVETTGPWFYVTNEDSYEVVFSTTTPNQILFSGQTTYTVPNTTTTLKDDTRIDTYIEYGLSGGKLYVKFFPSLSEDPITITGNTNVADGLDHHIVLQRTPADGMFRSNYVLNTIVGDRNQWSAVTGGIRHGLAGAQTTTDKYYSNPATGEVFHGFEIWIDGQLDHRSTEFNTTHTAPIVKQLGGKTSIAQKQDPGTGQILRYRINSSNGFIGTLTSIVGRISTTKINALSSYTVDYADMPRFPAEAKTLTHAAIDPQTINKLAQLALYDGNVIETDFATASAEMIMPTVSTNVQKVLRLFWNADQTTGTNFGVTTDGKEFAIDTYSVTKQLSNNPSHVYNVDAAMRDGMANAETAATPTVISNWKDNNGIDRLINLSSDVDLSQYQSILFMDYPDSSDEIDGVLESNFYTYKQQQLEQLLSQVKNAVINDGISIFISNPTLAIQFGIISKETIITQNYEDEDTVSAEIDPFTTIKTIKYFDTHRNNRYEIISEFEGITTMPSYIMTDAISYTTDINDEYHLKYELREDGLNVGDELIIPSLPIISSQLNKDLAGYTNNRITTLSVVESSDVLVGTPIAKIAGTNYVTTIAIDAGEIIDGSEITGRIFVNFVEDALTMGIQEYNYGTIQIGLDVSTADEETETVEWQYSTTRTNRKLSASNNIIVNKGIFGQTYPTLGGGGPIVQSPTSSTYGNIRGDYDNGNESFTSSIYYDISSEAYPTDTIFVASMTFRGLEWLNQSSNVFDIGGDATSPLQSDWDEAIQLSITSLEKITLYIQEEIK